MLFRSKQLATIKRLKTPQAPGVCKIYFIPVERVYSDPVSFTSTGLILSLPVMYSKLSTLDVTKPSRDYTEVLKENERGDYFEITVNGKMPFERQDNYLIVKDLIHHRYIVLVKSTSGLIRWLGTKENPVKMLQTHSNVPGSNATEFTFVWNSPERPLLLGIAIPPELL